MIGSYVKTPLNCELSASLSLREARAEADLPSSPLEGAVITGLDTKFNSIQDLRGQKAGISRIGRSVSFLLDV